MKPKRKPSSRNKQRKKAPKKQPRNACRPAPKEATTDFGAPFAPLEAWQHVDEVNDRAVVQWRVASGTCAECFRSDFHSLLCSRNKPAGPDAGFRRESVSPPADRALHCASCDVDPDVCEFCGVPHSETCPHRSWWRRNLIPLAACALGVLSVVAPLAWKWLA